jgi:drug/metabolite transporter (DMT)-like permease
MQKPSPQAPIHATSRPLVAIGMMCLAWAVFAGVDTTAKYFATMTDIPTTQVVWVRFIAQIGVMIAVLGLVAVPDVMRTRRPWVQIARSLLALASTVCNFLALRHLRLDQATTINFLAPLTIALLAGPLLGEWIGWRRGIAIAVGFAGAVVAIRPGFAPDSVPAFAVFMAFGTMLTFSLFGIATRYLAAYDRAGVTLFYSVLAGALVMAPFALADWVWPATAAAWMLLLSMGVYAALGHYLFIVAHRYAPASSLAPFLYFSLLTHSTAGFLVFDQVPDRWTLAGATIVIASGLYLLHRERATARAAAVAMTTEAASQR